MLRDCFLGRADDTLTDGGVHGFNVFFSILYVNHGFLLEQKPTGFLEIPSGIDILSRGFAGGEVDCNCMGIWG